jgi:lipopolysaccharide biosynthesis regulator YciM
MSGLLILFLVALGCTAAGVLIGRYYVPDDRALKRGAKRASIYIRVINQLLSRDREAAIAGLRDVVEDNEDDVEPYFALGSLFRSRGEWERAIRVHQAIELREPDDKGIRLRVHYELGLDFRAAGMPRRATKAMEECLSIKAKHPGALKALCGLYEEQGRYYEAADCWSRLVKLGEPRSAREPHLLAAAAQRALAAGDRSSARSLVKEALSLDREHAHVCIAAAEVAAADAEHEAAQKHLVRALRADSGLVGYVLPGLRRTQAALSAKAGIAVEDDSDAVYEKVAATLQDLVGKHKQPAPLRLALADCRSRFAPEMALDDLDHLAAEEPSLLPARVAAGRIALASGDADRVRQELTKLVGHEGALAWALDGEWRCSSCGYAEGGFFWRCKSCRHWGTAGPNVGDRDIGRRRERRQEKRRPVGLIDGGKALPHAAPEPAEAEERTLGTIERASSWLAEALGRRGSDDSQ